MTRLGLGSLTLAALLAGCGGGGDGPPPPPPGDYAAFVAWQNILDPQVPVGPWTVVGRGNDGNTYEATLSVQVGTDAQFPLDGPGGPARFVTNFGSQLKANGSVIGTGQIQVFFDPSWQVQGIRNSSTVTGSGTNVTCDKVIETFLPAASVRVNTAGTLYDADIYDSCDAATGVFTGQSKNTWSIQYEGNIVFMCLSTRDVGLGNQPVVTTEEDCFEIDSAGTLGTRARVTITDNTAPAFQVVMRNY